MRRYDLPLLIAVGFLVFAGLLNLFSLDRELFGRQIIWVFLGLAPILVLPLINLKPIFTYRWVILGVYLVSVLLLALTYAIAPTISDVLRWLVVGGVHIQPSEFAKIALIILLSSFFAGRHIAIGRVSIVIASFIYFAIPAGLVLLQPDLGTVFILFAIWVGYLLFSEIPVKNLLIMFLLFLVVVTFAWGFVFQDYQKDRITGLFNPEYDPLGINYNVIQSKIAIGSAGIFGKGFGQGTQSQLGFLPESANDFAFSAFVEEWGLLGGLLLIIAFVFLIYRILHLGLVSDNNFSKLLALGTAVMFVSHFIINTGSNVGLLPVVGVNFPFLSYGGSSLLTSSILVGIIQNTARRRSGY